MNRFLDAMEQEANASALRTISWKVHLSSSPAKVFQILSTPEGRRSFWADSAEGSGDHIVFRFSNGSVLRSRVISSDPGREFRLTYFEDSTVTFRLQGDPGGGTSLLLVEEGVPDRNWTENLAGWVSVLLNLKAAVDFGVDLRNHDPEHTWENGYVDV